MLTGGSWTGLLLSPTPIFFAVFIATVTFSALSSCEFYLLPANIVAVNIVFSLGTSNVVTFFFSFLFFLKKKNKSLDLIKYLKKGFSCAYSTSQIYKVLNSLFLLIFF